MYREFLKNVRVKVSISLPSFTFSKIERDCLAAALPRRLARIERAFLRENEKDLTIYSRNRGSKYGLIEAFMWINGVRVVCYNCGMNNELQKYIQDGLKSGAHPKNIRKALVDAGWDELEVEKTLRSVSTNQLPLASIPGKKSALGKNTVLAVGLICSAILIIGIAVVIVSIRGKNIKTTLGGIPAEQQSPSNVAVSSSKTQPTVAVPSQTVGISPTQTVQPTLGSLPSDEVAATIGPTGGEIIGKSGLKMQIPAGVLGSEIPIKITLLSVDPQLTRLEPDTDLKLLALLSVDMLGEYRGEGWGQDFINLIIRPTHATSYATYDIPLDLKVPIATGYSGQVLLVEIANWDGVMSAVAVDDTLAKDGYAHFKPPAYQKNTVTILTNIFGIYALPSSELFRKILLWEDGQPLNGAIASGPYRSIISVSDERGEITLPVPATGEAEVYVYSPMYPELQVAFKHTGAVSQAPWVRETKPSLIDKFTRLNDRAVATILQHLHNTALNNDWSYRIDAMKALADRNDPQIVPEFCRVIHEDPESNVRSEAVRFMETLPVSEEVKSCLNDALNDKDKYVRNVAKDALKGIGIKEFNIQKCEVLKDAIERDKCYNFEAQSSKNFTGCEKIQAQNTKDDCYYKVAGLKQDYKLCFYLDNYRNNSFSGLEDKCLFEIATRTNNMQACSEIQSLNLDKKSGLKADCYSQISNLRNNIRVCDDITESHSTLTVSSERIDSRDLCYLILGKIQKKPEVCTLMKDGKIYCYQQLAEETKDINLCKKINDVSGEDWCYYYVAKEYKELTICEFIKSVDVRNRCLGK